jgi:putative ABC transport system permease protein
MFEQDRWKEIFHVLKQNKLRTFLTAFGIAWGIFMLMIMLGASSGLGNGMARNLGDFAVNSCFMWTQPTTMPYKGFQKGRTYDFELKDIEMLRKQIPEIQDLSPRLNRGSQPVSRNNKSEGFNIFGDYPQYNNIDPVTIVKGRYINRNDIENYRKVIVVGERVRDALFKQDEEALGQYLKINGIYFKIVGIYRSRHSGGWGNFQNGCIEMPLTTMQKAFNLGNIVGWFGMTAQRNASVKDVQDKAMKLLKAAHFIHPDDEMAIGHENVEEEFRNINGMFIGISIVVWIVGLGTLFAGVVGVSNIMLVVVRERTQEFGIQRALGATPWKIISQLLMESAFLTTTAGYVGLFFGIGLVRLLGKVLPPNIQEVIYNPDISLKIAFSSLAILIVSGIIAGIIPARKAVSMKPIDAIRSEYK